MSNTVSAFCGSTKGRTPPKSSITTRVDAGGQIMIRVPSHREPTHPGEMLLEEFLKPMKLSQRDLANGIQVPYQRVNELINGKRGVTPGTALRLAKYFGNTPAFWMNLQLRWDLYHAQQTEAEALRRIRRVRKAG
jgi:addiction module HigA family antidote